MRIVDLDIPRAGTTDLNIAPIENLSAALFERRGCSYFFRYSLLVTVKTGGCEKAIIKTHGDSRALSRTFELYGAEPTEELFLQDIVNSNLRSVKWMDEGIIVLNQANSNASSPCALNLWGWVRPNRAGVSKMSYRLSSLISDYSHRPRRYTGSTGSSAQ